MPRSITLAASLGLCLAGTAGFAIAQQTVATTPSTPAVAPGAALDAALAGDWRAPQDMLRDRYRHPAQTLAFFGVQPDETVIEITPGGGWYADILAPYLRPHGHYIAAIWDDAITGQPGYRYTLNKTLRDKITARPDVYGQPELRAFDAKAPSFGPPNSADTVLTFRNAHNWVADGNAEAYFKAFFVVLEDKSEINANPRDDTHHPNGVWTLPPTNSHDAADDAKYRAIGESDRMTLRFRKP